jgi:hypothetical protein
MGLRRKPKTSSTTYSMEHKFRRLLANEGRQPVMTERLIPKGGLHRRPVSVLVSTVVAVGGPRELSSDFPQAE